MDVAVSNALLQADIYIKPSPGYPALPPGMALKLSNAFNGPKQSPRERIVSLNYLWHALKLTRLTTEQCIYIRFTDDRLKYRAASQVVPSRILAHWTKFPTWRSLTQLLVVCS